ncbi:MAG: alpha-mannosidase [Microcoleaceae cyanobacterium]
MTQTVTNQWSIPEYIEHLRRLTLVDVQMQWQIWDQTSILPTLDAWENWPQVQLNPQNHIAWPKGQTVIWLSQTLTVPLPLETSVETPNLEQYDLTGYSLRLGLRWWAEDAQIYVNQTWVQAGDLFDCFTRVLLSNSVRPGDQFTVALKLISPGHDQGALVESYCQYEGPENCFHSQQIDPGFLADEIEIVYIYLTQGLKHKTVQAQGLDQLHQALAPMNESAVSKTETFQKSLYSCRQNLLKLYLELQSDLPDLTLKLVGHAHLDLAWLWPVEETWKAAQRTFESVLNLQQDFPELIFSHSTPALYEWIEQNRPDLFTQIQQKVRENRWEVAAGLWVEPELNILGGESLVRQVLYGQRYVQAKFGQYSQVAWLPDSFGFCWQLPQILQQGKIQYFVTQKLRWNDTTQFPHGVFWWRSPDGSQVLSYMSALIGERIDPIKMVKYGVEWHQQTDLNEALWLPGVGDHGGGPTRDMLEIARRWQQSPVFPQLEFTTVSEYLDQVTPQKNSNFPVWNDELYLEFHRGCYTTHGDQKHWNRHCERLLYEVEIWASIAALWAGLNYPKTQLEIAWKKVLFNQFHDILPGSSIHSVYVAANQTWQEVERICLEILHQSFEGICHQTLFPYPPQLNAIPILVFNALNWVRSEVVALTLPASELPWKICQSSGESVLSQSSQDQLLFQASDIPSVGYRVFWLCPEDSENATQKSADFTGSEWVLENPFLVVQISAKTGNILQIFDRVNQQDVLANEEGNQLQFFQDQGQYWDAWNIDPNYQNYVLTEIQLQSIQWIERGDLQQRLRVIRCFRNSEFCQDYILRINSSILTIESTVDWQETHVLVKATFPLNLSAELASCEIPCGVIQRPTRPKTAAERAQWEIPAMNWVELNSGDYGVSLLNNCKYGYDIQPSQIRLTLLRGSTWPDPVADQGIHHFTYEIYPHAGSWKEANVVHQGYELNQPLRVNLLHPEVVKFNCNSQALDEKSFLDLQAKNLILMALKQSELNPQDWILRCYESEGKSVTLKLAGSLITESLGKESFTPVNLLEEPLEAIREKEVLEEKPEEIVESCGSFECRSFTVDPWKIVSFRLS